MSIHAALLKIISLIVPIARVFEVVQPLGRARVIAVGDVATGLRRTCRTDGLVLVPPTDLAAEKAARTKIAFIQAIHFVVHVVVHFGALEALVAGGGASLTR